MTEELYTEEFLSKKRSGSLAKSQHPSKEENFEANKTSKYLKDSDAVGSLTAQEKVIEIEDPCEKNPYPYLLKLEEAIFKHYRESKLCIIYIQEIKKKLEMQNLKEALYLADELEDFLDFLLLQSEKRDLRREYG